MPEHTKQASAQDDDNILKKIGKENGNEPECDRVQRVGSAEVKMTLWA